MSWEDEDDYMLDAPEGVHVPPPVFVPSAAIGDFAAAPKAEAVESEPAGPAVVKPKHEAKARLKEAEERNARERAAMAAAAAEAAAAGDVPLADPAAEKRRLASLQAKAEAEAFAADALGMGARKTGSIEGAVAALALGDADSYAALGKAVAKRVFDAAGSSRGGSEKAMRFFAEALQAAGDPLSVDDLRKLEDQLGALRNKKLAADRASKPGAKKKGGAKGGGVGSAIDCSCPSAAARARAASDPPPPSPLTPPITSLPRNSPSFDSTDDEVYAARSNVGDVTASMSAAGLGGVATASEGGAFQRTRHVEESDFM
jgi:hypothetical protein